ncbi:MAG: NAD(P)-dependent oxidoreductase [Chloroflexaceae bacterium]|jgi:3-hydroxyisobutyrate dehydrogenase|nr:NAD(P)-dependent oxidoreductase [Chloroflexaceae bacterium]
MQTIAFLGAGAMGSRVAHNLLAAGYPVRVYNRSTEPLAALEAAGATIAATPRAAATGADVVISMVRDDEASRVVWLDAETGALGGLRAGAVAIEASTLTPEWVTELAETVRATGAAFVEAPVLGTRPQAEARQLIVLAGGEAADLARVQEVLQASASAVHHMGAVGTAATMKLAVNTLYGVQVAIWAEVLNLLERGGLPAARAVAVLNTLPTTSPAMQGAGNMMAAGNYAPMFPIELVDKDFGYAQALARALGATTPTLDVVRTLYAQANATGYGNDNIVGIKKLFG